MRRQANATGIYIHYPYCIRKCAYCDFYSVGLEDSGRYDRGAGVDPRLQRAYRDAVIRELRERAPAFQNYRSVNTIFFGGGTASLLQPEIIADVLVQIREHFEITAGAEITLEGNPENFHSTYLKQLEDAGVTRVNVGLQTFREDLLDLVNRYYDPGRYEEVLANLANSNIAAVGGDLIYGFPGQSRADFEHDLVRVLEHKAVNHLSIYSLTVEPGTPYAAQLRQRKIEAPLEGLQEDIFRELPEIMRAAGFEHYEVSNFARPGFSCRHNLRYWLYESYMGLGPGAHGFDGTHRYGNPRNVAAWQSNPAGAPQLEHEPLTDLPLSYLRLARGIRAEVFEAVLCEEGDYPREVAAAAAELFERWAARGLGRREDDGFAWSMDGLLTLDDRVLEMSEVLEQAAGIKA